MRVPREIASGPNPPPASRFFKSHFMQPGHSYRTTELQAGLVSKQANRFPDNTTHFPVQPRVSIRRTPSRTPIPLDNLPTSRRTPTRFSYSPRGTPVLPEAVTRPKGRQAGHLSERTDDFREAGP